MTPDEHLERADHHQQTGVALHDAARRDWAAVCYFYSAYHLMRRALTTDPIFSDLASLKKIHKTLIPDDRDAESHRARAGAGTRNWGVNDLVAALYPQARVDYDFLHVSSVEVRYYSRLRRDLDDVKAALLRVRAHADAGSLVAAPPAR